MIGLGRWLVAGLAALGAGAAAALISRRRPGDGPEVPPAVGPPPSVGVISEQQAALDEARERLRRRADEVRAQLEKDRD